MSDRWHSRDIPAFTAMRKSKDLDLPSISISIKKGNVRRLNSASRRVRIGRPAKRGGGPTNRTSRPDRPHYGMIPRSSKWRNGRRTRFRSWREQSRGSSPQHSRGVRRMPDESLETSVLSKWRNGRRTRFRSWREQSRGSSSLPFGTHENRPGLPGGFSIHRRYRRRSDTGDASGMSENRNPTVNRSSPPDRIARTANETAEGTYPDNAA